MKLNLVDKNVSIASKVGEIITNLLKHEIGKEEAINQISSLFDEKKKKSISAVTKCTCEKDEIFFDEELEIIWCKCGKLFAKENEPILKSAGIRFNHKTDEYENIPAK